MTKETTICIILGLFAMFSYNAFLIYRDGQLFEAYNQPTPHERYCKQLKTWHPDCKVE